MNPQQKQIRSRRRKALHQGFSLWEMTIILSLAAGLLSAILLLAPQLRRQVTAEDHAMLMLKADRQLQGFAAEQGRLPCPDSTGDGLEDCAGVAKAGLPYETLGLGRAAYSSGRVALRYGVYRNGAADADLAVLVDRYNPVNTDGKITVANNTNALDLCDALDSAAAATSSNSLVYFQDGTTVHNVAYGLALAGAHDSDGVNGLFDGINAVPGGLGFEAPYRGASLDYDDQVLVRDFLSLGASLNCDVTRRSLNMLADAVDVQTAVIKSAVTMTVSAILFGGLVVLAGAITLLGALKAVASMALAVAGLSTAAGLLSAAIGSCAVLVGCAAIPGYITAVALWVFAIAVVALWLIAIATALVLQAIALGLATAVAIQAGLSAPNINDAIQEANTQATAARTQYNDEIGETNTKIITAQASADTAVSSSLAAKNAADQLATAAASFVTAANDTNNATMISYATTAQSQASNAVTEATAAEGKASQAKGHVDDGAMDGTANPTAAATDFDLAVNIVTPPVVDSDGKVVTPAVVGGVYPAAVADLGLALASIEAAKSAGNSGKLLAYPLSAPPPTALVWTAATSAAGTVETKADAAETKATEAQLDVAAAQSDALAAGGALGNLAKLDEAATDLENAAMAMECQAVAPLFKPPGCPADPPVITVWASAADILKAADKRGLAQ